MAGRLPIPLTIPAPACALPLLLSLGACATAHHAQTAFEARGGRVYHGGVHVVRTGAAMARTTVDETYNGMGSAVAAPFRDFNLLQEKAPAALLKARNAPYDTAGLTSCAAVEEEIATLDLALGPDLDTPQADGQRLRSQQVASLAADAAVEAAKGAVDHFVPVRGVIRELSGAKRSEKRMRTALLAGSVRRGFLKAIGMQQNCAWPAAPVDFTPRPTPAPVQVAEVAAKLRPPSLAPAPTALPAAALVRVAVISPPPAGSAPAQAAPDATPAPAAAYVAPTLSPGRR